METETLPEEQEQEVPTGEEAEAAKPAQRLFEYSRFIHVGPGAAECEDGENGKCKDEGHLHAWLTMPNSIQHGDIQEKARAAKARRQLAMRNPETDSYAMMEAELDTLIRGDREILLDTLVEQNLAKRLPEMIREIRAREEFEDYGQHREEFTRLDAMDDDERPSEEYETVKKIVDDFTTAVQDELEGQRTSERGALEAASDDDLREMLRVERIETESEEISRRTYYLWTAFVGVRKVSNRNARLYGSLDELRAAAPEVVKAIDDTMEELELRLVRGDAAGN